jgi:hypothetical protein
MGTRIKIETLSLGDVRPYGWPEKKDPSGKVDSHGHEFELVVTLSFEKYLSTGKVRYSKDDDDHVIDWPQKAIWNAAWDVDPLCRSMPLLEWKEQIRFYEVDNHGKWTYVGEYNTDMFALAPRAKTFGGLYPGIGLAGGRGWCDPWSSPMYNPGMRTLTTRAKPKGYDTASLAEQMQIVARLFRDKKERLDVIVTDRPGCTKNPSGAPMGGGGGQVPLTSSDSRCRVIHFSLTFAGTGLPVVHCTQILETKKGVPTICKFVDGRLSPAQVENVGNQMKWRTQLSLTNYRDPGNWNLLF